MSELGKLDPVRVKDMFDKQEKQISALEQQLAVLREAVNAAIDCGMVPTTSASDGGAAKYGEQVKVADMLRAAVKEQDN